MYTNGFITSVPVPFAAVVIFSPSDHHRPRYVGQEVGGRPQGRGKYYYGVNTNFVQFLLEAMFD